jgi:hypothetical protein
MKTTYRVEISAKYPAWNERPEIMEIRAETKKDAIRFARAEMRRSGNVLRSDGPSKYMVID